MQTFNEQSFKYIALDKQLNELVDITAYVEEGGSIEYNSLSTLKANCNIPISLGAEETLNLNAIRIYEVLNKVETCLGTFLISTPASSYDNAIQNVDCTGYSTLWRLNSNTPSDRYFVAQGTNAVAEVKRILDSLGYEYDIAESTKTTSVNVEWDYGTSWLTIINDLLAAINYTSLCVNAMGVYIATDYVLPEDKEPDITLNEDDLDNILEPKQNNELDLFNIPNRFVMYVNNAETNLCAIYERTYGETGTDNTWVNTYVESVSDAADYDTLYAMCKKKSAESVSIYNKVQISTAITMLPTYMPTIELNHYKAIGKYQCTSFTIDLSVGGSMDLNLRKVVTA